MTTRWRIRRLLKSVSATGRRRCEEARGEFLASVTHDLRTPLSCIVGYSTTLESRWRDLSDEERARFLHRIVLNGHELERRIANFLEYSRLEADDINLDCRSCDLSGAVAAAVDRTRFMLETHLLLVAVPDDLAVIGDECALTRIIENLLGNAAKYSPAGSSIRLFAERTGSRIVLSVEDEGPGVAPEDADRIFDRFYRATPKGRGPKGTGVGLAGVRQLVELMDGRVWVETPAGGGSRFSVSLPVASTAPVRRPAPVLSLHSAR